MVEGELVAVGGSRTAWPWAKDRAQGLLEHTATLHGAVGSGAPSLHLRTVVGSGRCEILHYAATLLWAVGSGVFRPTATLHRVVGVLQSTATLHGAGGSGYSSLSCRITRGSGQWVSFSALPQCGEE